MNIAATKQKKRDGWLAVGFIHLVIELNFELQMVQATQI